jgi:hypothetical protein
MKDSSEHPEQIDKEGIVIPGSYKSSKAGDQYLLYDGFDSSRDIKALQ